jgi:hypothetical protein
VEEARRKPEQQPEHELCEGEQDEQGTHKGIMPTPAWVSHPYGA